MILTLEHLIGCMPYSGDRAPIYLECLNTATHEFQIEGPQRLAMFLAQVAHESGSLRYTRELADGSAYEGRRDLGNDSPGDGKKYRGRGLLQVTGKYNTLKCLTALGRKLDDLDYLETPMGASRSAGWFWYSNGLNMPADKGLFWTVSKNINGGTNGLDDRIQHYIRCRKALGL
jgi:putative chitinase